MSAERSPEQPAAIRTTAATQWTGFAAQDDAAAAAAALESGAVLYFPDLAFVLAADEERFLTAAIAGKHSKNVSFNIAGGTVKGAALDAADVGPVTAMMRRYCDQATALVSALSPRYASALRVGRTSYRPVEVAGRSASVRQDDTRLHVDAFVTTPTSGDRILRVFTNVNRAGRGRHWQIGAPFADVAETFVSRLPAPLPGSAWLLKATGLTRGRRTRYDHMMLKLHDAMKEDTDYQARLARSDFWFPPGSTWMCFTDMVSHAVLAGQFMFEQTFYLPVAAMADEAKAPLRVLERLARRPLA